MTKVYVLYFVIEHFHVADKLVTTHNPSPASTSTISLVIQNKTVKLYQTCSGKLTCIYTKRYSIFLILQLIYEYMS